MTETRPVPALGMPTLLETAQLESCAALCRELGLQFVELNMNLPQYQADRIDVRELLDAARRYGIFYTIHLEETLNVSDWNPLVARAYRETVFRAVELAEALGCPLLNMHLPNGVYFTLPDRKAYLFEEYREQYLESLHSFREEYQRYAGDTGPRLCVENCGGYPAFQREALEFLLESPAFGLTLDVGHSHAAGKTDEPFLQTHRDRLLHMHLHDGAGQQDHLPLGAGEIALPRYLRLAEERGCRIVLEIKTAAGLQRSAEWMKHYREEAGERHCL